MHPNTINLWEYSDVVVHSNSTVVVVRSAAEKLFGRGGEQLFYSPCKSRKYYNKAQSFIIF